MDGGLRVYKALNHPHRSPDLREAGFSLTIHTVYETKDDGHRQYGITELQHDTLVAAFKADYFTVPREAPLTELATQLELSHQAVSERLRRATGNLVESTLIVADETDGT